VTPRAGLFAGALALALAACSSAPAPVHRAAGAPPRTAHHVQRTGHHAKRAHLHAVPLAEKTMSRPTPNRCAHNDAAQKVIVSVAAQHLWMCARHRLVRQTPVTTGMVGQWTNTPTGNYWIQGRNRDTTLTLNTGATYPVKYWIPFDAPLFGFHDSSWQNFPYGSPKYKTAGSHGCVHMPLKAIAFLYRWAVHPTAVHIS
jgi:hypothetical protein